MGQDQSSYAHISLEDKLKYLVEKKSPVIDRIPDMWKNPPGLPAAHLDAIETEFALLFTEDKKAGAVEPTTEAAPTEEIPGDVPVGSTSDSTEVSGEASEKPIEDFEGEAKLEDSSGKDHAT